MEALADLLEAGLLGVDAHEEVEAVAAVDVHVQADRPESVRRVLVAAVDGVVAEAPVVPVAAASGLLVPLVVVGRAEVVDVGALAVGDLAQKAEVHEVEGEHLVFAVAAVLELHAVALRALARLHELPALLHREGARHLGDHVLAVLHRVERDRHMQLPGRGVVDEVDLGILAHALPVLGPLVAVDLRRRRLLVGEVLERALAARGVDVADGGDVTARHEREAGNAGLPASESDHAHAQVAERLVMVGGHLPGTRDADILGHAMRGNCGGAHPKRPLQEISSVLLHVRSFRSLWHLLCLKIIFSAQARAQA